MTDEDIDWKRIAEAYTHPIAMLILDELKSGPLSPVAVHRRVQPVAKLPAIGYHFRALADRGLIEEVDKIPRRGAIEHVYQIAAVLP
jgi:hypothetical protein